MRILAIETSCDETAVAILEASGTIDDGVSVSVLGNGLISQIDLHAQYGGVFPTLAKREHQKNLVPLLLQALQEADMHAQTETTLDRAAYESIFAREPELLESFVAFGKKTARPNIDAIALTAGPGLEPALWVGINFAKALSMLWNLPIIPVNHMEGHVASALLEKESENLFTIPAIRFPLLALLISGGHTELVLMNEWASRTIVGQTRDDAVGEAFDKAARMMGLSYPGGPEMSRLAGEARSAGAASSISLPRPMIGDGTCDFSFSGLKTAVLYHLKKIPDVSDEQKREVAHAFEDAVTEVLVAKTRRAIEEHAPQTLAVGGGVAANMEIRKALESLAAEYAGMKFRVPEKGLTGDNAVMIGAAGYLNHCAGVPRATSDSLVARGNWRISERL